MDKNAFPRTNDAISKLKNVLKCQLCSELKNHNLVIYYKSCGHFFCTDCNKNEPSCLLCSSGKRELPLSLAKDDKKISALYEKILNLKLPSRQEIEEIIKNQTSSNDICSDSFDNDNFFKTSTKKNFISKQRNEPVTNVKKEAESRKRKSADNVLKFPTVKTLDINDTKAQKSKCETPLKTNLLQNKNSKGPSSKKKLNVTKTNCKGETQLHIACKKANLAEMKDLLEAGADINAKDAAGWTPLHDAVVNGKMEVIMFLLENGANVNTPGLDNNSALHEAVTSGRTEVCKILMSYGADNKSKNIEGQTPLDVAKEYNYLEILDVLLHTSASLNSDMSSETKHTNNLENAVIWKCQLTKSEDEMVHKFTQEFKCELVSTYSYLMKSNLTHIIVPNDKRISLNFSVLSSVFSGPIVANYQWIHDSVDEKKIKPVDDYVPKDEFYSGFQNCRLNKLKGCPGLFNGCRFFFGGTFENYVVKDIKICKEHLRSIVEKNGGQVLKRSPDPERVTELNVPYHAEEKSSIAKTCYFIIYQSEKWEPKPIYNMAHLKTLPIEWLVVCILNFQLIDPVETDVYVKKFFLS